MRVRLLDELFLSIPGPTNSTESTLEDTVLPGQHDSYGTGMSTSEKNEDFKPLPISRRHYDQYAWALGTWQLSTTALANWKVDSTQ